MEGHELLCVLNGDRFARFKIENNFVLCSMIFEDPPDVLVTRERIEEAQENRDADHAIYQAVQDLSVNPRIDLFKLRGDPEWNQFIQEHEKEKTEDHVGGHDPCRNL